MPNVTVTPAQTFLSGDTVTANSLNLLGQPTVVVALQDGEIATAKLANNAVTAAKLATTLDLSANTLTLPAAQPLSRPVLTGVREAIVNLGAVSGSQTFNLNSGNIFQVKPNGAITVAPSNVPASGTFVGILIRHEGDGTARTYTWPANTKWAYGEVPVTTSTNAKFDLISLFTYDGGTTWFGQILGQNY
jgi:hypothetical protein